jgi:hypothetical protein
MAVLSTLLGAKNLRGVPCISQLHLGKGSSTRITGRGTYFLSSNARWLSLMSLLASAPSELMLLITTVMMGDGWKPEDANTLQHLQLVRRD